MHSRKLGGGLIMILAAVVLAGFLAEKLPLSEPATGPAQPVLERELNPGEFYTIVSEDGRTIDKTSRVVETGDEFYDENDRHFRVTRVSGHTAYAVEVKEEEAASVTGDYLVAQGARPRIAIYTTHSDESYLPSDGSESVPANGGVIKVASVMAQKLETMGLEVDHDKRPHDPHDDDAYRRSRRTVFQLARLGPSVLIDVHRDGVPDADFYKDHIAGQPVTKIRLVVGRQNQNRQANLDFARRVKEVVNQDYPGLIRGIFLAQGNYNQDLSPRSLLVEIGTYTNSRDDAQRAASLFASSLPKVLGIRTPPSGLGPGPTGPVPQVPSTGGDWSALGWFLVLGLVAGGIYLVVSSGSIEGAVQRLRQFISGEWANLLGKSIWRWPRRERPAGGEKNDRRDWPRNDDRADYQKD